MKRFVTENISISLKQVLRGSPMTHDAINSSAPDKRVLINDIKVTRQIKRNSYLHRSRYYLKIYG